MRTRARRHAATVLVVAAAAETAELTFEPADSGAYEVELHESVALLGTLEVR